MLRKHGSLISILEFLTSILSFPGGPYLCLESSVKRLSYQLFSVQISYPQRYFPDHLNSALPRSYKDMFQFIIQGLSFELSNSHHCLRLPLPPLVGVFISHPFPLEYELSILWESSPSYLIMYPHSPIKYLSQQSENESEVAQSCETLCDPVDCSPPGSSVLGILQARILQWVAISFSRGSSRPRDRTQVSRIAGRRFNLWATGEAPVTC